MATHTIIDMMLSQYARMPDHLGKLRLFNILTKIFGKDRIVTRNQFGEMELDTTDLVQREILFRGQYEPLTLNLVRRLLEPGDMFLDIGSHVGEFSLAAAQCVGADGRVVAFEPNPPICAALLRNRERSKPIARFDVVCAALADGGKIVPFATDSIDNEGSARIVSHAEANALFCVTTTFRHVAEAIDIGPVSVAKIDVEGSEFFVLRDILSRDPALHPNHIVFEFIPDAFDYSEPPEVLIELLGAHGYILRTVEGRPFIAGNELPENNVWAARIDAVV